jgi:hypothetical protein
LRFSSSTEHRLPTSYDTNPVDRALPNGSYELSIYYSDKRELLGNSQQFFKDFVWKSIPQ